MASLMATAIAAICASSSGNYHEACTHSIDAGTRQVGIRQTADAAEDKTVQYVNAKFQDNAPKPLQEAVGAGGFVYKTVKDRRLTFRVPNFGIASSISNTITPESYVVTVEWRF